MTDSGYPRVMREWRRGTSLAQDSAVVHEGDIADVSVYMYRAQHRQHSYLVKGRAVTFYTSLNWVQLDAGDGAGEAWHALKVPDDAEISLYGDQLLVQLRSAWEVTGAAGKRTYKQGSLLAAGICDFVRRGTAGTNDTRMHNVCMHALSTLIKFVHFLYTVDFVVLFEPTATVSLEGYCATRRFLVLETLDTVKSRYSFWQYQDSVEQERDAAAWVFRGSEDRK